MGSFRLQRGQKHRLDEKLDPYGKQNVPAHTASATASTTTPQQVQEFASLLAASTLKQQAAFAMI